jgi:hypothetical protein
MRTMFAAYALFITLGLAYCVVLAVMSR